MILEHLKEIPFLAPQSTCPDFFPAGLTWFGACSKQLSALSDMSVPSDRKSAYLVGSVRPILHNDYVVTESVTRYSYQPTAQDVIAQLAMLGEIKNIHDSSVITAMVQHIYDFLVSSSEFLPDDLPMNWIWCDSACSFQPATRFAIQTPIPLEPFVFSISSDQFLVEYKHLFTKVGIRDSIPNSFLVEILLELSQTSELSQHNVKLSLSILQYLHRIEFENKNEVLMLTADNTLRPANECVYVDKEWVKQRTAKTKHCFTYVNNSITADVAQYFGAESLSHKVAPSKKLAVDYDTIDPNETLTRVISGIVKDYCGNIDIFKELIQNADDAKATQVKFVIDWRQHGRQHLLAEELGCWQGPALIAYNNAVFSDEDLENICKLAAETKLKDPLKTGRFGLGFCSTYYLTDVPSFISRRYFTMFDPHTWYLKDRVSPSQPGITIDLVDTPEDLQVYEDQFTPYNGIFNCDIFNLEDEGFPGTIFRFPIRSKHCRSSEILSKWHSRQNIDDLVQDFKDEASQILLFLKNIEQVEVYVIDETARHSSEMRKLFSVTKQSNTEARLNMIQNYRSHPQPICSPCVIHFDTEQHHSSHHYLVASALNLQGMDQPGLIPLAEIAVEVEKDNLTPKPVENAQLYCFLPLHVSYKSFLPFHVNGFFDVGKDQCNLIGAQGSDGSKWNTALVKGAVPLALECLVVHIAENSNLHKIENEDERVTKLFSYYSLWPGSSRDVTGKRLSLASVIEDSSIDHLVKSNRSILWCDIEGGRWITPSDAYLFDSEIPSEVKKQVIDFLLDNGYAILPTSTPSAIRSVLSQQINQLNQVITYETFFTKVFLPKLGCIDIDTCHYHLMFVLQSYQKLRSEFGWVKEVLQSIECIPTRCSEKLVRPTQLVDPRQSYTAALYSPEEGRFPTEKLAEDSDVMKSLVEFGMISENLPVSELVERANTVAVVASSSIQEAATRMKVIFNYITAVESKMSSSATDSTREERITALWNIEFLTPKPCPSDVSLTWCSTEQFVSPSQVFSSEHSDLLFSQKPVIELQTDLIDFLGISRNEPQLDTVLNHTSELISFLQQTDVICSSTSDYLDQVFSSIYSYIAKHCALKPDLIKQSLQGKKWIWQDGHLLSSNQVLREWKHDLYPYLCQLSITKSKKSSEMERLFELLGVQHEATVECLKAILLQVQSDYHDNPLSGDAVEFVIHVLGVLSDKLQEADKDILLITADNTLKPASMCTFDDRKWVKQKATSHRSYTFVHNKVPAIQKFGVQPLSHKIAPSTKLAFKYKTTGPQESITRRIGGIVKDYSGDLDIFKELIQNADDAKATQVKFIIDWREHSKENLIAEELGCWQGPALIAYNNAVFSDEDLVNICKLAAETKLKDPLKTGRFGLGFCSTYYLTDVPSFISRRYFTMFDPHTWYLKDRVSPSQPGIVIDLVETQNDLEIYEHQFAPFDGLFDCEVFKLEDEGFPGTIFRFPFRTRECDTSEICKKCHSQKDIDELVHNFQQEALNILLFLKNVEQVEVHVLEENSTHPSQMRKLFAVTKQSNTEARLNMIQNHSSHPQPICSPCVIHFDTEQHHSSHHYLVASALSPQAMDQPGLIPLAEIAVEVIEKDNRLIPMPIENAFFFCFLPLPFNNFLPFHVNGFFDVGKDRRNLTEAQDSDGSKWNSALVEGAVPLALECLIAYIAKKCNNLCMVEVEEKRHDALINYYSLWLGNDHETTKSGWLTKMIIDSSKKLLSKSPEHILWCDINGGEWVSPCDAHLFDSELPEVVVRQAISQLLENNYAVLPFSTLPQIKDILRAELNVLNHVFTYERFFMEVLLPNLPNIAEGVRNNQLMFALRRYQEMKAAAQFGWVKDMLISTECIPTQYSGLLVSPRWLVDPRQPHIASLYRPEEGRFPDQLFTDDDIVMATLVEFGMIHKCLPIAELVERAEAIATNCSTELMEALFVYILKIEHFDIDTEDREQRVTALWNIRFLKPKSCPSDISLPWCSTKQFVSPSQVFSSEYSDLLFSQRPVVEFSEKQTDLIDCLGISRNEPQLDTVISHTFELISFLQQTDVICSSTSDYLDQVFSSIYSYIAKHCALKSDVIKQSLEGQKWIWQNGHLLSSKQVLREWKHDLYPYLCQLSITKKSSGMERLCELLGVQHEATVKCLKAILVQVQSDFHDNPLSGDAVEFVIHVLGVLSTKAESPDEQLLVITADRRLQLAMNCVFDDREWIKRMATSISHRRFTFIHEGITANQAKQFGIKPLSQKIAPSKKIAIGYKTAGPHESITRRIGGIVKDYSGNIDIFKELVQNADDAKATQVKFVIDWRQHNKKHLLAKELECWQGPALIAYNNAVFSDKDLENICKLAAETKLKDPLKTGRFGLGFCSTYYLTDVPSFISRRYFTMFDPHTWYLKDRVSPSQPGITIDLVDTREDLQVYEDQFAPFDGLFDCKVFNLEDEGFPGTIFRFPLRRRECESSEICKKCHSRGNIDELVQFFEQEASNILLFLKNVEQVEVYVLEENSTCPSQMSKIFAVTKQSNTEARMNMIQNHSSHPQPVCSPCIIKFDSKQHHSSHHYLVASALSPQAMDQPGLIPLAEIAVEVIEKDNRLIPMPMKCARLFCFLPLPFEIHLPFHVNGFFDVGKDRRNLTEAQDSDGSKWNSALVEGAVPLALECLITYIAQKCNSLRGNDLMSYYSVWPKEDSSMDTEQTKWLANVIVKSSKSLLARSSRKILWCEINGGQWVSPCNAYLLDSEGLPQEIANHVVTLLLDMKNPILPISTPLSIQHILKERSNHLEYVFTYERFFKRVLIANLHSSFCTSHVVYALSSCHGWVKEVIVSTNCIPTQCTEMLVKPSQLIDPRTLHIAPLYSPEEGRFPSKMFADNSTVMESLVRFGMVSESLSILELVHRAKTVMLLAKTDVKKALERMKNICNYLLEIEHKHFYRSSSSTEREERIQALWNIQFLKPKPCPSDISLPWCSTEQFVSPSQVLSSEYSSLVFTQKPVVEFSDEQLVKCLGINKNAPELELVLKHIHELIKYVRRNEAISQSTSEYLDKVFDSIYEYLAKKCTKNLALIKQSLTGQKWIWQDGHLHSSEQVLREWNHNFYPYLCRLSITKSSQSELFKHLGVQKEATGALLLKIVEQVKSDFRENALTEKATKFVVHVLQELCSKVESFESSTNVLVVTADKTLKPACECVYDDREWKANKKIMRRFSFIHQEFSATQAKKLGVNPLSQKIAPSRQLPFDYKAAGPHESITKRIGGIVKDYSGNIDIFKELIQNADDAKATQVKFVIDWRQHGRQHLFTEELGCWQGPALIAYNNAVFSDEDLENICKLAAETKLKDPLKTGRFGLGFCSTYYLTDVPSFISRRYFTMFDPHTWYLKDRVSLSQPGMVIDLVDTPEEDLKDYDDQFAPFDGLFDCKIFKLKKDGFNGTIFRFPFRSKDCDSSEICKTCHSREDIDALVHHLKDEASNILLFLKNVEQVEVFVVENRATFSSGKKRVFSVTKQSKNAADRMDMIQNHSSHPQPICSSCIIKFDSKLHHSSHHYLVASALSPQAMDQPGLIPLAEIVVEVIENDGLLIPKPLVNALFFCFLPLPFESHLPFHVNGFFDVGKDRRNFTAAQGSDGSKWNTALVEGAVPLALECILGYLAEHCNLCRKEKQTERLDILKHYYSLWVGSSRLVETTTKVWLSKAIIDSSKNHLPKCDRNILWCDKNGGEWVSPQNAYLLVTKLPDEVAKEVVFLLLKKGYPILPLSTRYSIQSMLKKQLGALEHIFTYERFFVEIFVPNIKELTAAVRDNQVIFALTKYRESPSDYGWVKDTVMSTNCIPTQCTEELVRPSRLIDPRTPYIAPLYSPEEGRFPSKVFAENNTVMSTLVKFNMISASLPVSELVERARTVTSLAGISTEEACARMENILNYLIGIEPSYFIPVSLSIIDSREERRVALWDVKFLKPKSCPSDISLPWCSTEQFVSPSQVFSSVHSDLLFSQKPVVEFHEGQIRLIEYLGISKNTPTLSVVLDHVTALIKFLEYEPAKEESMPYLDEIFFKIYMYLAEQKEAEETIKTCLSGSKWIWQNEHLLSSSQVVRQWEYRSSLYLCELSQSNSSKKLEQLFQLLGVENEASVDRLIDILRQIKLDYGEKPLPNKKVLEFVVDVVKVLHNKLSLTDKDQYDDVVFLLPDEEGVLRLASMITCDNGLRGELTWIQKLPLFVKFQEEGKRFLHADVPREHSLTLGAKPILDALLKETVDDSFADGTDFSQEENLVDRLNSILKKYSDNSAIFKEFIQNADDAKASELVFVLDHRNNFPDKSLLTMEDGQWKKLQTVPALCIFNNRPFSESDMQGICQLGRGGKGYSDETIGRFGIGFNVAYHVTDCPMFITFDSTGNPTDFCVFDPLSHYLPSSLKNKRGRRWKISHDFVSQFPDQFKPFLKDEFSTFQSLAPQCLSDLSQGYAVFRLPFVRKMPSYADVNERVLCNGTRMSVYKMKEYFSELQSTAKECLLFLKNLRSISYFEISISGKCSHHFTSTVEDVSKPMNCTYQLTATYMETVSAVTHSGMYSTASTEHKRTSETKWIVHKKGCFRSADCVELLDKASREGLKPTGGVAAMLHRTLQNGHLFCFLPMLSLSGVPVHLNAHFLVDDSRKHLTTIKGLEQWNPTIGSELLVPSYVELMLSAREYVTGSQESIKWFYRLLPDITSGSTIDQLKVGKGVYEYLLLNNYAVLLDQRSVDRKEKKMKWLSLKETSNIGYFCKSHYLDSYHQVTVASNLNSVLLSLEMPITCAPDYVYDSLCAVSQQYNESMEGLITPDKVLTYLKGIYLSTDNETVISQNCEMLLKFCIQRSRDNELQSLLTGVPLLLSMTGTLETKGFLFSRRFSTILPHCKHFFVNQRLEECYGLSKRLTDANVICKPDVQFVARNIQIPKNDPAKLSSTQAQIVSSLWEYLTQAILHNPLTSNALTEHFNTCAIIPAKNGYYYPPSLGKCVFKEEAGSKNAVLCVMKKLAFGYAELDQVTIGSAALRYISDIVSSSTSPNDVITCLNLKPPSTYSVVFTSDEVNAFISTVVQSMDIPAKVLNCLKKLPLFETVNDSFISLYEKSISIVPQGIPTAGLLAICKATGQVVLKSPDSHRELFYRKVMDYQSYNYNASMFYSTFLLPNLHRLSDSDLIVHLDYISTHSQDSDWQSVITTLKQIALIPLPRRGRVLVSELCDPENRFYITFAQDKLLPSQWHKWLFLLRQLGLKTTVSQDEWLTMARLSAREAEHPKNKEKCKKQCDTLLATLKHITEENTDYVYGSKLTSNFFDFLVEASRIKFIFCPAPSELESLVKTLSNRSVASSCYSMFTCFRGAVSARNDHLAGLTRVVLPSSCSPVVLDRKISEALGVQYSLEAKAVVDNLVQLCSEITKTSVISSNKETAAAIRTLKSIFHEHYKFLEERAEDKCIDVLTDKECVLLFPHNDDYTYSLVKPSQLVQHIPSQSDFSPFKYGVPYEIRSFSRLLKRLKVEEEMTPMQCIEILTEIKSEVDRSKSKLSEDRHFSSVCIHAFNALVLSLRQPKSPLPDFKQVKCILPSEDLELMEASQLVYDDAPYIKSRLRGSRQYTFLNKPPPDENGQCTPPSCLGVTSLSSIAIETLHPNVDLTHNRCVQDELNRCQWVHNLLDTFNSSEFTEGLERLYWHEHSINPKTTPEFMDAMKLLYKCKIKCVHEIKTVIYVQNREVQGSEDTKKLCHFVTQPGGTLLYISHSSLQFSPQLLMLQLAASIAKVVKHMLRNESHIVAILECSPQSIQRTLDLAQVAPYDSKAVDSANTICLGNKFEGHLDDKDFLIICNYSPDELVLYHPLGTNEYKYARVVRSSYQPGCEVTNQYLEICTDMNNTPIKVSPLQVYKIFDISHKAALWKTSSSTARFTTSVVLADVPCDLILLKTWIKHILNTPLFLNYYHSLHHISLRLVAHMHYMLVTCNNNLKCFLNGVQEVIELVSLARYSSSELKMCVDEIDKLVYKLTGAPIPKIVTPTKALPTTRSPPKVKRQQKAASYHPSSTPPSQRISLATPLVVPAPSATTPAAYQPPALPIGRSRFSQIPQQAAANPFPNLGYNLQRSWTSVPSCAPPQPPPIDLEKAKMWLQQAKADLLAAHFNLNESESRRDVSCRFPALVCFLTHDVVEKCLKGVLYAKCGLPDHLIDSALVVDLETELAKSPDAVTEQFMAVVKECAMQVNEHVLKSRYPNYQVPPCAPATVYTVLQATEALTAAKKLIQSAAELPDVRELIGDLESLPPTRLTTALSYMEADQVVPSFWAKHSSGEEVKLVLLDPFQEEYHSISALFSISMPRCEIRRIDRIQNKLLWRKYCDRAKQMYHYNQAVSERSLFHGTSSHKPKEIFEGDSSFDMRFCQRGMWGRGNYFAVNASYSDSYSYRAEGGVRQMLVAYVLTGWSYSCHSDRALTKPPPLPGSQGGASVKRRYDCVCGETGGSKVYITYDNDKAYPAYLITYTRP